MSSASIADGVICRKLSKFFWARSGSETAVCIFCLNKVKDKLNRLFVIQLTYQREPAARGPD